MVWLAWLINYTHVVVNSWADKAGGDYNLSWLFFCILCITSLINSVSEFPWLWKCDAKVGARTTKSIVLTLTYLVSVICNLFSVPRLEPHTILAFSVTYYFIMLHDYYYVVVPTPTFHNTLSVPSSHRFQLSTFLLFSPHRFIDDYHFKFLLH